MKDGVIAGRPSLRRTGPVGRPYTKPKADARVPELTPWSAGHQATRGAGRKGTTRGVRAA